MPYGTKLRSKSAYRKIFETFRNRIKRLGLGKLLIEHVGGTALNNPSGKGDIDIYIAYQNKKEQARLNSVLKKMLGMPAKVTPARIRYNTFIDGIEVEIQLIDKKSFDTATALRDYLNSHPMEAKRYARGVAKMRKEFLADMFEFKQQFALKAVSRKT